MRGANETIELNPEGLKQLQGALAMLLVESQPPKAVVVNLYNVKQVTEACLPVLLNFFLQLKKRQIEVSFISPRTELVTLFTRLKLFEIFPMYFNREELLFNQRIAV